VTEAFDWRTQTTRRGTVSRLQRYVRGDCEWPEGCAEQEPLLYDSDADDLLLCVWHSRQRAKDNPRIERCDDCGQGPAWRDPLSGKNEFFCAACHGKRGAVFQNRWSTTVRTGRELNIHDKAKCELEGYGTECKGEVKWRGALDMLACNHHAGKKSAGPEWHT
jgi:hypothetical protein